MAAYAQGLNILHHANIGRHQNEIDAETSPLKHPEYYQYDFNLADVAELWRRGSVVSSWLLDLTASALLKSPDLSEFSGRVSDSGEGRWTISAAIDEAVPAPVLSTALFARFCSRGEDEFSNKILSAMRYEFGGHHEKARISDVFQRRTVKMGEQSVFAMSHPTPNIEARFRMFFSATLKVVSFHYHFESLVAMSNNK